MSDAFMCMRNQVFKKLIFHVRYISQAQFHCQHLKVWVWNRLIICRNYLPKYLLRMQSVDRFYGLLNKAGATAFWKYMRWPLNVNPSQSSYLSDPNNKHTLLPFAKDFKISWLYRHRSSYNIYIYMIIYRGRNVKHRMRYCLAIDQRLILVILLCYIIGMYRYTIADHVRNGLAISMHLHI